MIEMAGLRPFSDKYIKEIESREVAEKLEAKYARGLDGYVSTDGPTEIQVSVELSKVGDILQRTYTEVLQQVQILRNINRDYSMILEEVEFMKYVEGLCAARLLFSGKAFARSDVRKRAANLVMPELIAIALAGIGRCQVPDIEVTLEPKMSQLGTYDQAWIDDLEKTSNKLESLKGFIALAKMPMTDTGDYETMTFLWMEGLNGELELRHEKAGIHPVKALRASFFKITGNQLINTLRYRLVYGNELWFQQIIRNQIKGSGEYDE